MRRISGKLTFSGIRSVAFAQQSPILEAESKAKGYQSNLWVDDFYGDREGVKGGEKPTVVVIPRVLELINLSQINASKTHSIFKKEPAAHSSLFTMKGYSPMFAAELEAIAKERQLSSKWWITYSKLRELNVEMLEGQRAFPFYMRATTKLFNVDQLQNPSSLDYVPISFNGRVYQKSSLSYEQLRNFNQECEAKVGLIIHSSQIERYGLQLKSGSKGIDSLFFRIERHSLFSIEDVVGYEVILSQLNRTAFPNQAAFLMTGDPVLTQVDVDKKLIKYVVTGTEIKTNAWTLKSGAVPLNESGRNNKSTVYSVNQLENPDQAFQMCCTKPLYKQSK